MNYKKIVIASMGVVLGVGALTGCAAKALEVELNVVFKNEGQIVAHDTVTQFKNILTPSIDAAYIPENYRFLGWTAYEVNELDYSDAVNFKTQYIGAGRMVHYMDVRDFASNNTVVLDALIMHKDDIPQEYHYAVLAWYDKVGNSGLDQARMDTFETMLKDHLTSEGVSESDVNSVVVRGYAGNVGPTTGQILYDGDVDIMLGWGSVSNITTTGSIPEESILATHDYKIVNNGTEHNRYIHTFDNSEGAQKVLDYLLSAEAISFFTGA